ncbi:hypothetical protein Dsin_022312 [Dipteronia sinensis]|uniref:Uncharacterized protein n=1 Tax=Dipteronia sinensis TaxID=43782 RepID=A0AAE0E114_9ROSI|nr:hypothetical protein Dsin_022312 [Dipteronia sinensis]
MIKPCHNNNGEINFQGNSLELSSEKFHDDFDAESILDEEIAQGIDSIMGNFSVKNESNNNYWDVHFSPVSAKCNQREGACLGEEAAA